MSNSFSHILSSVLQSCKAVFGICCLSFISKIKCCTNTNTFWVMQGAKYAPIKETKTETKSVDCANAWYVLTHYKKFTAHIAETNSNVGSIHHNCICLAFNTWTGLYRWKRISKGSSAIKTLWSIPAPSLATKDKIVELSASRVGVQQTNYTHWSASEHKSGLMYLVCFKQGNLLKTAKTGGASSRTHLRLSLYVVFISFRKRFLFGVSLNSATFLS